MVQLRSDRLRRVAYGTRKVRGAQAGGNRQLTSYHRNYVSQDILRRIMSDYFGYDVHFVMNITDIDNKARSGARSPLPHL